MPQRGLDVEGVDVVERGAPQAHDQGTPARQLLRPRERHVTHVRGGHHAVDDAPVARGVRVDALAGHEQLQRALAAQIADHDRHDHHRPHADFDLRCAEQRGVGRDEEVAAEREPEAAGERVPVDTANDRLAQPFHGEEQLDEQPAFAMTVHLGRVGVKAGKIRPGAERLVARAGEQHDTHVVVALRRGKRGREVPQHRRADGVALLGTVERDGRDELVDVVEDVGQVHAVQVRRRRR